MSSLFGVRALTENAVHGLNSTAYKYAGETSELQTIMFEAAHDLSQIHNGLYVADAMMESAVLFEGASAEVLVEGVMKDFFDKIIEAFKKLWAKIKAWFQKAFKAIEVFFLPGAKFVQKYGKELEQKEIKGYTYKGYNWNKTLVKQMLEDGVDFETAEFPVFSGITDLVDCVNEFYESNLTETSKSEEFTKAKEAFIKKASKGKVTNVSELKSQLKEDACGGTEKETIEAFSVYSVAAMIAFVKKNKKITTRLKRTEARIDRSMVNFIKGVENMKKALSSEEKTKYSSLINNCSSAVKEFFNLMLVSVEVTIDIAKKQNSEFVGALKGLMYHKETKEGFSAYEGGSILESAMRVF